MCVHVCLCGEWMCVYVCKCVGLFTQVPLENAARVSQARSTREEEEGVRVPHNSPVGAVHSTTGGRDTQGGDTWQLEG